MIRPLGAMQVSGFGRGLPEGAPCVGILPRDPRSMRGLRGGISAALPGLTRASISHMMASSMAGLAGVRISASVGRCPATTEVGSLRFAVPVS